MAVRSKVSDIFAQLKFINEFSTPFVRNSKIGYCATTLEVAVNHINALSKDDLMPPE